jgi:hypothetical protein
MEGCDVVVIPVGKGAQDEDESSQAPIPFMQLFRFADHHDKVSPVLSGFVSPFFLNCVLSLCRF